MPSETIGPDWSHVLAAMRILDVAASSQGVFASGKGGIWQSDNAVEWQNVVTKDTTVTALAAGAGGAVGFGVCPSVGMGFCDLVSNWYTLDGVIWVEQRAAPLDAGEFAQVFGMVEEPGEGRFFAVGQDDAARAAVWSGEASGYWVLEFEYPSDSSAMTSIVRYDGGYIAVGRTSRPVGDTDVDVAAVWLHEDGAWTADGMQWTLVSDDSSVFSPSTSTSDEPASSRANDVAVGDFGIVVVGSVTHGDQPSDTHPAVWHSPDMGQTWNLMENLWGLEHDSWIAGVTDTPEGLVAVGQLDQATAIWTSRDGTDWTLVVLDESVFRAARGLHDIVLHDQVLYVSGSGGVWARTVGETTSVPEAIAAWDQFAASIELLAADALTQIDLIDSAMDALSDQEPTQDGWFDSCCEDPRNELLTILDDIGAELESGEKLAQDLGLDTWSEADRYLAIAEGGVRHAESLLENEIEAAGIRTARSMVHSGLRGIVRETIVGCVRACVID
jgi:hypothetical protein